MAYRYLIDNNELNKRDKYPICTLIRWYRGGRFLDILGFSSYVAIIHHGDSLQIKLDPDGKVYDNINRWYRMKLGYKVIDASMEGY